MLTQIIPLKDRTDFRWSSRIPATETIRVRAADSFGVFRGITDDFDCGESFQPRGLEAPPGVAPSHVGSPQAASRARRVSSAVGHHDCDPGLGADVCDSPQGRTYSKSRNCRRQLTGRANAHNALPLGLRVHTSRDLARS